MNRRTMLGGLGAAGLASLSGCLGLLGMDEHESSPAGVDPSVSDETGYERTGIDDVVVERDVGVGAASETVSVTNYLTEYEKSVDLGPIGSQRAAVFNVLTTPQVGIAGRNFNPVEDMDATELVELVEDNYDEIGNISQEDEAEITILEESTNRTRFSADATFNGHDLEVDLHVSEAVEAGDDLLVTIGVYPQRVRDREEGNVITLMEGVTTDIDMDDVESGGDGNETEDDGNDENDSSSDDGGSEDGSDDGSNDDGSDDDDGPLGSLE